VRHLTVWTLLLSVVAVAQDADREIEKDFERLMKTVAAPKDQDDAARRATVEAFRGALDDFFSRWAPRASDLGPGLRPLARAYLLAGRPVDAAPHLEAFVRRFPDAEDRDEATMDLGAAYLDLGEPNKARDLYDAFLKRRPEGDLAPAARFYLGVAKIEGGDLDGGVESLEKAATTSGDHPIVADARLKIVRALAEAGRVDDARTRLSAMLKEAPDAAALRALKEDLDRIGAPAPELLRVRTWIGGNGASLSASKGRVVVLCFFADVYEASRAELKALAALKKEFAGKPVDFVGLTTYYRRKTTTQDDEDAILKNVLRDLEVEFPCGVVEDFSLLRAYGVKGVPHTVVVDAAGNVAHQKTGAARFETRGAAALKAAIDRALRSIEKGSAK
jgi:TolA-binding protein/peroxiredoxin